MLSEKNKHFLNSIRPAFKRLSIESPYLSVKYHILSEDASEDELCSQVFTPINHPELVLDGTLLPASTGSRLSSLVKRYARRSAVPTISTSYAIGDESNQWDDLDNEESKYLIHIHQPGDVIAFVVGNLVEHHNLSGGVVMFDDSFGE